MPFRKFLFAENCILDSGVWWGFLSGCAPAEKVSIFSSKCHPPFQKNYQRAVQWKIEAIYAHFFPPGKKKVIGECRKVSSRLEWHQTTPLRDFPASQVKKKIVNILWGSIQLTEAIIYDFQLKFLTREHTLGPERVFMGSKHRMPN